MRLAFGDGAVLDALRHDQQLAGIEDHLPVTELHPQPPGDDPEELVLVVVVVPDELPLELDDLHVRVVQLADDLGAPPLVEACELLAALHLREHVLIVRIDATVPRSWPAQLFTSGAVEKLPRRSSPSLHHDRR